MPDFSTWPVPILLGLNMLFAGWMGSLILRRPFERNDITYVVIPALFVTILTMALGVPMWRHTPFGDATDIGLLTFLALCIPASRPRTPPRIEALGQTMDEAMTNIEKLDDRFVPNGFYKLRKVNFIDNETGKRWMMTIRPLRDEDADASKEAVS